MEFVPEWLSVWQPFGDWEFVADLDGICVSEGIKMAVKQTAGRDSLGDFAPKFAQLNEFPGLGLVAEIMHRFGSYMAVKGLVGY